LKIERKMAIQGQVYWGQWKGDKGLILYNNLRKKTAQFIQTL